MVRRSGYRRSGLACVLLLGSVATGQAAGLSEGQITLPQPLSADDFKAVDPALATLGQLLFYDPVLSGNRNISCGTCHNHDHASGDGLALGVGEGGEGVGPERTTGVGESRIVKRVPRNAPPLFNLGHKDIRVLFHDGRLTKDDTYGRGFNSPAEEWFPDGINGIMAAQALFPLTSQTEMAGQPRENEIAGASNERIDTVWPIIAARVRAVPGYLPLFRDAFDHVETPGDITMVEIANALGGFLEQEFVAADTPFDRYLRGDAAALSAQAERGMALFYGDANCASCHSGSLMSDQEFHALALPPFGPGRTRAFDPMPRDVGRMGETDRLEDAYRFRTPMLRNVAKTGPYGHNGAYSTLEGIIRHHLDPRTAFDAWTAENVSLPVHERLQAVDFAVREDRFEMARVRSKIDIDPVSLTDDDVAELVAFLEALTDEKSLAGRMGKPDAVPSGLPVD